MYMPMINCFPFWKCGERVIDFNVVTATRSLCHFEGVLTLFPAPSSPDAVPLSVSGGQLQRAQQLLPPAQAAGAPPIQEAAHSDDAQVAAATPARPEQL